MESVRQNSGLKPLVILGTGGSAFDVLDIVEAINAIEPTWCVEGFLDDARPVGSFHLGFKVLGRLSDAPRFPAWSYINAIGSDQSFRRRPEIIGSTGLSPDHFATLVHPAASVSSRARIGRGALVNPGAIVAGGVTIGDHVMLCPGCIVGHESCVLDYSIVAPGAVISGLVELGPTCYVGAGALVRQRLRVGEGSLIGMGAVVVRDLARESRVVGNPARSLEARETPVRASSDLRIHS